jgi:hypothetical protein
MLAQPTKCAVRERRVSVAGWRQDTRAEARVPVFPCWGWPGSVCGGERRYLDRTGAVRRCCGAFDRGSGRRIASPRSGGPRVRLGGVGMGGRSAVSSLRCGMDEQLNARSDRRPVREVEPRAGIALC